MPRTEEELMDLAGSEAYRGLKDAADILSAKKQGEDIATEFLKAAKLDASDSESGADALSVRKIQQALASVGMPVRRTGVIDAPTVRAVNAIFAGWSGAPPALRTGTLTARDVSSQLPTVWKYLARAVGDAQKFGDATKE